MVGDRLENETRKKLNYRIYPGKLFNSLFGIISGGITIYLFIIIFSGLQFWIAVLVLVIIILSTFFIRALFRLKEVLLSEQSLTEKLMIADDNRDTLTKIVEEKNNTIDLLRNEINKEAAQKRLLYILWRSGGSSPPLKVVKEALDIKDIEVSVDDNEIQSS